MTLLAWLDERLNITALKQKLLDREVPDRLTWWHTLGSATLAVFLLQAATGMALATYYSASPDHAYASVNFLDRVVAGGALLRGVHHWGASAMVVLIAAHMIRVFTFGSYKYPREVNWLVGLGLLGVVLGFSFTGYLLPWDEKAYWATQVGTGIAGTTPIIGNTMVLLLRGGPELGAATLARFYAFHVLWLPASLILLVLPHLAMVIRQGIAPQPRALEENAPARTSDPAYPSYYKTSYAATKRHGVRFWPDIIAKDALVALITIAIVIAMALLLPPHLEGPADPTDVSYIPRPEWYFLPLYQLLKLVPGSAESLIAVGVPGLLVAVLVALPFFDRGSTRSLVRRPVALAGLVVILGGSGLLLGAAVRDRAPERTPSGQPLTDIQLAGRAMFQTQQCGSCHIVNGEGSGREGPDLSTIGVLHSSAWMHSFIESPRRFHAESKMPSFGYPKLSHEEIEEIAQYLASLRGLTPPSVEPEYQDTFPQDLPAPDAATGGMNHNPRHP